MALILREMSTTYGRTPGGYIWTLLQPLGMILVMAYAWSLLAKSPSLGTSFILFKATGFLILRMCMGLGGTIGGAMGYSKALLSYPRVTWMDTIIARFSLNVLVKVVVMTIILTGVLIYEEIRSVLDWSRLFQTVTLTALLGLGIGCLNCYLFQRFPVWRNIWGILTAPMLIISGVIIIYEDMPQMAQQVLWYNPILHLTGMMRDAYYPMYSPQYISILYISLWIVIPMVIGLLLLRQFHRDLLKR